MNTRMLFLLAAVAAIVSFLPGTTSATPIALINPLMQDPLPGQFPYPTWQGPGVDPPYDSVDDGQSIRNSPSGWQSVNGVGPGEDNREYNPTTADFPGAGWQCQFAFSAGDRADNTQRQNSPRYHDQHPVRRRIVGTGLGQPSLVQHLNRR